MSILNNVTYTRKGAVISKKLPITPEEVHMHKTEKCRGLCKDQGRRDMDDLISRQAALDIVFDFAETPHRMYQQIRELPTIEPKHARWIDVSGATICSWCSANSEMEHYFRKGYRADYCPMCGARMDDDKKR